MRVIMLTHLLLQRKQRDHHHVNITQVSFRFLSSSLLPLIRHYLSIASRVAFQSPYSKQMKPHFDIPQFDISFSSDHDIFPQSTLPNIDMADDDLLKLLE
jgi:hypothetical protein